MAKMKVSDWLTTLGSHSIYSYSELTDDFKKETDKTPTWRTHSAGSLAVTQGTFKGVEELKSDDHEQVCCGWEIACDLATNLCAQTTFGYYHGRGSKFRVAISDLIREGF